MLESLLLSFLAYKLVIHYNVFYNLYMNLHLHFLLRMRLRRSKNSFYFSSSCFEFWHFISIKAESNFSTNSRVNFLCNVRYECNRINCIPEIGRSTLNTIADKPTYSNCRRRAHNPLWPMGTEKEKHIYPSR